MRMFFRRKGESVVINGDITVTVLDIDGDNVAMAIDAPEWLEIDGNEPISSIGDVDESSLLKPR